MRTRPVLALYLIASTRYIVQVQVKCEKQTRISAENSQLCLHASSGQFARSGVRGCASAESIIARMAPWTFPHGRNY